MNAPKKLGFGLMRLPKKGLSFDIPQFCRMTDMFLQAGFTYFDTAYVYLGSEAATKKALVDRHKRESFTLASKLNASVAPTASIAKKQLTTSLERTGAGYFDYYLLHTLMDNNHKKYDRFELWDFALEQKKAGLVKNIGFSFHSGPELLDELLTQHPEVDFVQLQINYLDWFSDKICSRANYEVARSHDVPIVIMEPVKGGKLADPPEEVKKLMKEVRPDMSYASWAIRFAASLDGVLAVLSGMSSIEQMTDNLSYMTNFEPLSADEQNVIRQAQSIMGKSEAIPCTACRYCEQGCPKQIPIPDIFTLANRHFPLGQTQTAKEEMKKVTEGKGKPQDCIACRKCEKVCPQHIEIVNELKKCREIS